MSKSYSHSSDICVFFMLSSKRKQKYKQNENKKKEKLHRDTNKVALYFEMMNENLLHVARMTLITM